MPAFSELERPPFSKYWSHEEAFSAWLADEDNIHYLRETLGLIGLVAKELEKEVEGFYVDIHARDEIFDIDVIVENQFGRSDHDHWGKANTYSATLGADVIVWVASEFTSAHREAVRDYNQSTDRAVFALRAEVLDIEGCEQPAFQLVSEVEPEEWQYSDKPLGLYQEHFFEEFIDFAERKGHDELTTGRVASYDEANPQAYFIPLGPGLAKNDYRLTIRVTRGGLEVVLECNVDDDHRTFDALESNQDEIEDSLHEAIERETEVVWNRGGESVNRDKIHARYTGEHFDPRDVGRYDDFHQWVLSTTTAFRSTLADEVQEHAPGD